MDHHTINKLAGSCYIMWAEPPKPAPHIEYPKLVYMADGSYVKVDNADEEAVARGEYEEEKPRRGRPPKAKE